MVDDATSGPAGPRASRVRPTMADVASRAGVSRALVSIVFRGAPGASEATRQRVLAAAVELDYRPDQRARLLGRGRSRSRTIGVSFSLQHEFHAALVEQLYLAGGRHGYELVLAAVAPARPEAEAVQSLVDFRCDAVLLLGPFLSVREVERLAERQPVVVVARALRSRRVDVVRTDDVAGARLAVEHLVALGHERIVHVHGGRAPGAVERRSGFREAVRSAGLPELGLVLGGLSEESGEAAAGVLLDDGLTLEPPTDLPTGLPTAVLAFNDMCAAGLLSTVRGRDVTVPERLSIVGYDDSRVARLASVALTTVGQDAATLAEQAVARAVGWAQGAVGAATQVLVPPHLVVRRTTAPPCGP